MQLINRLGRYLNWLYMQYSYVTALNILDGFERCIFNTIVLLMLGIFALSTYLFLPQQIYAIKNTFNYLLFESNNKWRE